MTEKNVMTARFTDSDILKVVVDPNDTIGHIYISTLDSDGEEIITDAYLSYPVLNLLISNTKTSDIKSNDISNVAAYGILKENITIKAGEMLEINTILGTLDGSTYAFPITMNNVTTYTVSNLINCVEYGTNIVATDLDITKVRHCDITITA